MGKAGRTKLVSNAVRRGTRFIVYVRVSAIGDRGDDLKSPEIQDDVCSKWAGAHGATIVDVIYDLDVSGRDFAKRKIKDIIERIRRGEADGVLVWKISRFGRNTLDSLLNIRHLRDEAHGLIASATENLDEIETPMGNFTLTQMLAIAQLQSDQIGETWMNVLDYRRTQLRLPPTGGPRFGYDYHKKVKGVPQEPSEAYTVDEVTGPWLALAYLDYTSGKPIADILQEMWDSGIRSVTGKRIIHTTLTQILDSGFGAGLLVDKRKCEHTGSGQWQLWEYSPGAHAAVITPEEWEAYRKKRMQTRPPREKNPVHKTTGLLFCATCERKGRIKWRGKKDRAKWRSFMCSFEKGAAWKTNKPCPAPFNIGQTLLENVVRTWLVAQATDDAAVSTAMARKERANRARADIAGIESQIAQLDKRLKNAIDMTLDKDDPLHEAYRTRAIDIQEEIAMLVRQKGDLATEADASELPPHTAFTALVTAWDDMDLGMLNEALRQIIYRIEIAPGHRSDGTRVRIIPVWER